MKCFIEDSLPPVFPYFHFKLLPFSRHSLLLEWPVALRSMNVTIGIKLFESAVANILVPNLHHLSLRGFLVRSLCPESRLIRSLGVLLRRVKTARSRDRVAGLGGGSKTSSPLRTVFYIFYVCMRPPTCGNNAIN